MFSDELLQKTEYVQDIIYRFLPEETGYQKVIMEAMNYSMQAGGKRIRPLLMLETARFIAKESLNEELIHPFMAAIEMIHTYSLIHDDLPALDNDEYRRGRKTSHMVYGEAIAILAGDALLNYSFETACKSFAMAEEDEGCLMRCVKAMTILAEKPGIYGMIGGQTVDVTMTGKTPDMDELTFIYEKKTGALIECSMVIGAVLAGADDDEIKIVEQAASDIGMAFQIQDDILDVYGDSDILGKPLMSDEENGKITMLKYLGYEQAKEQVKKLSEQAIEGLSTIHAGNAFLKELVKSLIFRNK